MINNKKAQGLSITTIILIILGVMVLVALILAFTIGWAGVKDWLKPSSGDDKIIDQCEIECAKGSVYDFCSVERKTGQSCKDLLDVATDTPGKVNIKPCGLTCTTTPGIGTCNAMVPNVDDDCKKISSKCIFQAGTSGAKNTCSYTP